MYQDGVKRKRLPPKRLFGQPEPDRTTESSTVTQAPDDPDVHDCTADEVIDLDLEDRVEVSGDRVSEMPQRCRRYSVGKEIGYAVYVHRDYETHLGDVVEWAKRHLPAKYDYTVVKLNQHNDSVSFIYCPGFDTEHEPAIAGIVVVNADGQVQRRSLPADPYIYHHKWLFVADDYSGFDVAASKERSEVWIKLADVDRSRIGRRNFWEQNVVPRIVGPTENHEGTCPTDLQPPIAGASTGDWVRSDEARRRLKLSTCELAHARQSGQVSFRKEGNAYLYLVKE